MSASLAMGVVVCRKPQKVTVLIAQSTIERQEVSCHSGMLS